MRDDRRSPEAQAYRRLYKTARWAARREAQLGSEPLCRMCGKRGLIVPASIADHVIPHRGDMRLFFEGELQSLCKPCHDGPKHSAEMRGYDTTIGADGYPVDERHPANR